MDLNVSLKLMELLFKTNDTEGKFSIWNRRFEHIFNMGHFSTFHCFSDVKNYQCINLENILLWLSRIKPVMCFLGFCKNPSNSVTGGINKIRTKVLLFPESKNIKYLSGSEVKSVKDWWNYHTYNHSCIGMEFPRHSSQNASSDVCKSQEILFENRVLLSNTFMKE